MFKDRFIFLIFNIFQADILCILAIYSRSFLNCKIHSAIQTDKPMPYYTILSWKSSTSKGVVRSFRMSHLRRSACDLPTPVLHTHIYAHIHTHTPYDGILPDIEQPTNSRPTCVPYSKLVPITCNRLHVTWLNWIIFTNQLWCHHVLMIWIVCPLDVHVLFNCSSIFDKIQN